MSVCHNEHNYSRLIPDACQHLKRETILPIQRQWCWQDCSAIDDQQIWAIRSHTSSNLEPQQLEFVS